MRFKMIGNEITHSTKSGIFGLFTKIEKHHEFTVLPSDKVDNYLKSTKSAYSVAFGSFDLFRVAKGFATNENSRFSVVGFFLNKSGETFDNAVFVKTRNISDISSLWEKMVSNEMTPDCKMMRSVVLKDKISGERIVLEAFFDLSIDFKNSAKGSMIESFNNEFVEIMMSATATDDFGKELDRVFTKALMKSRNENN